MSITLTFLSIFTLVPDPHLSCSAGHSLAFFFVASCLCLLLSAVYLNKRTTDSELNRSDNLSLVLFETLDRDLLGGIPTPVPQLPTYLYFECAIPCWMDSYQMGLYSFFYPDAIPSRGLRIKGTAEITSHLVFNHEGIHLLRPQHTASIVLLLLLPWSMVAGGETRIEIVCGITHRGFITIVLTRTS